MHTWTLLLAAGRSSRLGPEAGKKQFLVWRDRPLFWHAAHVFAAIPAVQGIVFVLPRQEHETYAQWVKETARKDGLGLAYTFAEGGEHRQDSVFSGLNTLPQKCSHVLIHDAARPFLSPDLIQRVILKLAQGALGVVPGLPVTDTIKRVQGEAVESTLPREKLYTVQTPQGFLREAVLSAHKTARARGWESTDDASLLEALDQEVAVVEGEETNRKITTRDDLKNLRQHQVRQPLVYTGWGYDVHRYGPGREMKLGGVAIPDAPNVEAHSDGDVVLHAIIDAVLGCLGRGDIGDHFPDSDPAYQGINSAALLAETLALARRDERHIYHLDVTIICQTPKLRPWKEAIQKNLCNLLGLPSGQVNIKATTEEGLGFTGQGKGIKAVAQIAGTEKT